MTLTSIENHLEPADLHLIKGLKRRWIHQVSLMPWRLGIGEAWRGIGCGSSDLAAE